MVARRRSLGIDENGLEVHMYDVPLEETIQREIACNPEFAEHMRDWGDRPPAPDGSFTSTQDGIAARNHPELGNLTYSGIHEYTHTTARACIIHSLSCMYTVRRSGTLSIRTLL